MHKKYLAVLPAVFAPAGFSASSALANGPCSLDSAPGSACGVTTPVTVNESIVTDNESDYYVF